MSGTVTVRKTLSDVLKIKADHLSMMSQLESINKRISENMKEILSYEPYRLEYRYGICGDKNPVEKHVDQQCWRYAVRLFDLEKYMLCTEYEKLNKQIEAFALPPFTEETVNSWLDGLKAQIYDNVRTMIMNVYDELINRTYYTGSGYSGRKKKKRNNNGVDNTFIITTMDYSRIFGYYHKPTITDDLEKVCYVMSGKTLPDITIIERMRSDRLHEASNDYFTIKVCKNGNTHFKLTDDIVNKLNVCGANRGIMPGDGVKIKIFDERW